MGGAGKAAGRDKKGGGDDEQYMWVESGCRLGTTRRQQGWTGCMLATADGTVHEQSMLFCCSTNSLICPCYTALMQACAAANGDGPRQ